MLQPGDEMHDYTFDKCCNAKQKASGEIRTRDLVLTKDALYRLSH